MRTSRTYPLAETPEPQRQFRLGPEPTPHNSELCITPSKEDLEITRRLREVGDLVGVRVLDHVVIGRGRYVSFVDDGYW